MPAYFFRYRNAFEAGQPRPVVRPWTRSLRRDADRKHWQLLVVPGGEVIRVEDHQHIRVDGVHVCAHRAEQLRQLTTGVRAHRQRSIRHVRYAERTDKLGHQGSVTSRRPRRYSAIAIASMAPALTLKSTMAC